MGTKVTFVELTAYEGVLPLATGYLQAYASQDPEIAAECSFEIFSRNATSERTAIAEELVAKNSDVYAVSCYLWNMGTTKWLLQRLYEERPDAKIILGGPQVMNHLTKYVSPDRENTVVCNGEGERTFYGYLKQVVSGEMNLRSVNGLSFWQNGEAITTPKSERIKDLMEVPSPFTTGVYKPGEYISAILETNRGCPFNCGFCAWGAATNDKVYKFEDDRVRQDITWISENGFQSIFIADANWGIGPRDVEFTEFIVDCKNKNGLPYRVDMASAKNRPDRMAKITETLVEGGLVTSQTISLQTMDQNTLNLIQRANIRLSAYTTLQQTLRAKGINSNIELIWPLPGETLQSYRQGIAELCRLHADVVVTYPQLLLHNTPIYEQRDVFGVQTARVPSDIAEADIVIGTKWVNFAEYELGVWYAYLVHALYNVRGLYYLANYLDRHEISPFDEFFTKAVEYFQGRMDTQISLYFAESVKNLGNYDFRDSGMVAHMVLHAHRDEFNAMVADFVRKQPWWPHHPGAQAAFELDLLARPYIYAEPARTPDYEFEHIGHQPIDEHSAALTVPAEIGTLLSDLDMLSYDGPPPENVIITHADGRKMPYTPEWGLDNNALYCQGLFVCQREYVPTFEVA
ncbi:B12-binding domain-containing radical SAM protein [Kibdelosporangium persicum]|uniref:Radical SAM domain-containing protein n=1 Tax=Kibdelosporangium persicum TaxID=2698649 RepID=A0ABX2FHZ0_9PSEU|nr:cobalamin-dependent protein [Kibdelosporangium persicum]NRN71036.1 Radical SAM domain-containing protein [Kibdelosporangium persicum]